MNDAELDTRIDIALQLLAYLEESRRAGKSFSEAITDAHIWLVRKEIAEVTSCLFPVAAEAQGGLFDTAWASWSDTGRRRSSKSKSKANWIKASKSVGERALLDALQRFVMSPDAQKDYGAYVPALDRWLSQKRYEGWLEETAPKRVGFV